MNTTAAPVPPQRRTSAKKPNGYFQLHLQGALSLPIAFWINLLLIPQLYALALAALNSFLPDMHAFAALIGLIIWFCGLCFALVLSIWAVVGTWFSVQRYAMAGGSRHIAGAAKIVCGIFALSWAFGGWWLLASVQAAP
ncbi:MULTISPECIES: hypothetical protein [Achromobacter]|uniref:hypothetical protein n=1 Tax=Achromobacter TaxID=222 RepID=UPI0023F68D5D|nr:hypothetical protein [Achromobacter anxifer]MDF8364655.1 hypothetical protein [Achromobacter anxifer]